MFDFEEELKKLPEAPGVYIMRDSRDNVLYVGKAVVLKNRVRSYFRGSHNPRISRMIEQIDHFEYIVTDSEYEALLLECNLIKKYKPKYNVLLKDDKNFPYIKVTVNEDYPRVILARKAEKDGAKYFGPYPGAETVRGVIDTAGRIIPTRLCGKKLTEGKTEDRVCLNYHIGLCPGPCAGCISKREYNENIRCLLELLSGKTDSAKKFVKEKMEESAGNLEFELAATYRDRLKAIEALEEKQKIVDPEGADFDIIALTSDEENTCLQIFFFRNGRISGRDYFIFENADAGDNSEIISSFVMQFYGKGRLIPRNIYCENEIDVKEQEMLSKWLSGEKGTKCTFYRPQKGEKRRLAEMVRNNAVITLENYRLSGRHKHVGKIKVLETLQKILGLEKIPNRIEAFDISNLGDSEIDASMVVFTEGAADKNGYRKFKMKTVDSRNDVGSMKETVARRLSHIKEGDIEFGGCPDLLLIDGGRGQVEAAEEAVRESGLSVPVCGMVKDDHHKTRGLYYGNREFLLAEEPELWHFISAVQNEAHRFAITYNRKLTEKRYRKSELDNIPGIGEAKRMQLYKALGSLPAIKAADVEQLAAVKGISRQLAEKIYKALREEEETNP